RACEKGYADPLDEELKMSLAYGCLQTEQWQKALEIFQSYSNRPVRMNTSGPWGKTFTPVLPAEQVALCRAKLGLTSIHDSREFEMETNIVCLHTPSTFMAAENGLWLGMDGKLIQLDATLKTN